MNVSEELWIAHFHWTLFHYIKSNCCSLVGPRAQPALATLVYLADALIEENIRTKVRFGLEYTSLHGLI